MSRFSASMHFKRVSQQRANLQTLGEVYFVIMLDIQGMIWINTNE
jgi:heme/copper-type cytochrome/quinol oxidase subunit 4